MDWRQAFLSHWAKVSTVNNGWQVDSDINCNRSKLNN